MLDTKPVAYTNVYKALKPKLVEAAELLRAAMSASAPILLRHHGDGDGYSGGVALEQALLELQQDRYGRPNVSRFKLRAPRYEMEDAAADLRTCSHPRLRDKKPVVVIIDNGSTSEDEPALKLLKLYRITAIVVDHHPIDEVDESLRRVHINPFLGGGDSDFTAGMLAVELAKLVNPQAKIEHLAALSGVSDKVSGEWQQAYLNAADREGFSESKLLQMYLALDYLIFFRMDSWKLVHDLLLGPKDLQEKLVEIFAGESQRLRAVRLKAFQQFAVTKGKTTTVDISGLFSGFEYPPPGRSVGLLYQELKQADPDALVLGMGGSFVTIRGKLPKELTVNDLISKLQKRIPIVSGGGHDVAGTIQFLPAERDEVIAELKKLIGF